MKTTNIFYSILIIFLINPVFADGTQPIGAGTSGNPYLVSTLDHLLWISTNSSSWGSYFEQTANIDASATSTWNGGLGFSPIGNNSNSFQGNYDGKGYSISGLTINRPSQEYIGLFGEIYASFSGLTINNITLKDVNITGKHYVGGLIGNASGRSITISNCSVTGTVYGGDGAGSGLFTGGLVGQFSGTVSGGNVSCYISYCSNGSNVTSENSYVGGIVGIKSGVSITYCFNEGTIYSQKSDAGGIVGKSNNYGTISQCYNYGNITTVVDRVGGIAGNVSGINNVITNCHNSGKIVGVNYVGGIAGNLFAATLSNCFNSGVIDGSGSTIGGICGYQYFVTISNSYNSGSISGDSYTGGIVGIQNSNISNCFNSGSISANSVFGGITAYSSSGTTSNSYWDTDVGPTTSVNGTGKTTAQMQTQSTFSGWDFTSTWVIDGGYPYLKGVGNLSGSGTSGDPLLIQSVNDLKLLSENSFYWDKYIRQESNINAGATKVWNSNSGFIPVGNSTTNFTGNFDGQNFAIYNLAIDRSSTDNIGLFGYILGGTVTNLNLINADITGSNNTGALAGVADEGTTITSCSSSGTITGANDTGGLIGEVTNRVVITGSSSSATVSGAKSVGGLIGQNINNDDTDSNKPLITSSFATGNVTGSSRNIGGFVGWNTGIIKQCYATGNAHGTSNESRIGGFVGSNAYNNGSTGKISDSYSRGNVTTDGLNTNSSHGLGGFNGAFYDKGQIENCYATGSVSSTGEKYGGFSGRVPTSAYVCAASFWDNQTSGQTTSADPAAGKTTTEMTDFNTFTTAGWDFVNETTNGNENIWDADQEGTVNDGYPILAWQSGADGVLPVELVLFTATLVENNIELNWQTATETNSYGFEVERAINNEELEINNWEKIGFVQGHGNSNSPKSYSYLDEDYDKDQELRLKYRLKQIDTDGTYEYYNLTAEVDATITSLNDKQLPEEFHLSQNYPNPFNPSTTIEYSLPVVDALSEVEVQNVTIKIYDILGNEVSQLVNKTQPPGFYEVEFDGRNLSSGLYIYRIKTNDFMDTKKMLLVK